MNSITAVIPCRKGSTRLGFDKQLSNFAGTTLLDIKVNQLLKSKYINKIILSSDDPNILNRYNHKKIKAYKRRPEHMISTDSWPDMCLEHVSEGDILITQCTVPFFNEYDEAIEKYRTEDCDSLMTGRIIQSFVYDPQIYQMINYDSSIEKWPKTQELPVWYEVDCSVFLISVENMKKYNDKIGKKTYCYSTNYLNSIDIDYKEEWEVAEKLWKALN